MEVQLERFGGRLCAGARGVADTRLTQIMATTCYSACVRRPRPYVRRSPRRDASLNRADACPYIIKYTHTKQQKVPPCRLITITNYNLITLLGALSPH